MGTVVVDSPRPTFRRRKMEEPDTASVPYSVEQDRRRIKLERIECSSTWAFDIAHHRDVDHVRGGLTGHGTLKRRCIACGRWVPPQDRRRGRCEDCRIYVPPAKLTEDAFIEPTPVSDSSPTSVSLARAAAAVMRPRSGSELPLPAEDDQTLAAAIAAYEATGDVEAFARATGDDEIADQQRRRYRANKIIRV